MSFRLLGCDILLIRLTEALTLAGDLFKLFLCLLFGSDYAVDVVDTLL